MAIIVPGMKCPLCAQPITQEHQIVSFPAFVSNQADPLWRFSDGVFHADCLTHDPLAATAKAISAQVVAASAPKMRVCVVCGELVTDPDNYLFLGYLTSDIASPLFAFNYLHFHLTHISGWHDRQRLLTLLEDMRNQARWKGESLNWLMKKLRGGEAQEFR